MKQEIAKAWVDALRSEKYKQTQYVLHDGVGFCCLGVLCDISKLSDWRSEGGTTQFYMGNTAQLPTVVQAWAGLKTDMGSIGGDDVHQPSLVALNDRGETFKQIADVIEKQWEKL